MMWTFKLCSISNLYLDDDNNNNNNNNLKGTDLQKTDKRRQLKTAYIIQLTLSTSNIIPNELLQSLILLNLSCAVHIVMQKSVIFNTWHTVRIFCRTMNKNCLVSDTSSFFENQLNCCEVRNVGGNEYNDKV